MINALKKRQIRLVFMLLILLCASVTCAQTTSDSGNAGELFTDALKFLNQVLEQYAHASTYHIETVEDNEMSGPFRRSWDRVVTIASAAPGNRYHFEVRAEGVWLVQVADGSTEWLYQPELRQYMQHPVPSSGPSPLQRSTSRGAFQLEQAQGARQRVVDMQRLFESATFLQNEELVVGGKRVRCRVIKAPRKELPGLSSKIVSQFTFWIDEKAGVIRKIAQYTEGPLRPDHPDDHYVNKRTVVFNVAEIDAASVPSQLFTFTPPLNAALVRDFDSDPQMVRVHGLTGKPVPLVELRSEDGTTVSLKSFAGKTILLDFWATWCLPCIESLPSLEKLYQAAGSKGLIMISIDEDEDSKKAADLWAKRKEPWPNFHADSAIVKQFPEHGIPYFVLIDGSGEVVFSDAGLDEDRLRAAIAKLNPSLFRSPLP